jgi:hypothetical protein
MGGIIKNTGQKASTALRLLGGQKSEADYYNSLASDADYQASYTWQATQRQNNYLLKSAAERSREIYKNYRQTLSSQKTALAASGRVGNSATEQAILKNSRLQALLDEEAVRSSLQDSIAENNLSAAERVRGLAESAAQYRKVAKDRTSLWTMGSNWLTLLNME